MGLSESITAPYAVVVLQMRRRRSGKRKKKEKERKDKERRKKFKEQAMLGGNVCLAIRAGCSTPIMCLVTHISVTLQWCR